MARPIRVLLVEDSEDDAELLLRELRRGDYAPECTRVDNAIDLDAALNGGSWDVVITDHNLPGYSSDAVISTLKQTGNDVPVIIVSGSIGEEIAVEAMKSGAHDYIMKNNLTRLVPAIAREIREAQIRLAHRKAEAMVMHLAYHDALTGLSNRAQFESQLSDTLETIDGGRSHGLLYMDLDQFKVVNDTCGHSAGDEMLKQLASMFRGPIRDQDTLARLGGDEFGFLLKNCPAEEAMRVAERVLRIVSEFRFAWEKKSFAIGASIGLVVLDDPSQTASDVLRMADLACYAAKEKGRNRIHLYRSGDQELAQRQGEMQWVGRINSALERNSFELFGQRIVPLAGKSREHMEVLLRMVDDRGERVLPGAFIPAAERFGLMPALDRWVVSATLKGLAAKKEEAESTPKYFINLSGATISEEKFSDFVLEALERNGISGDQIGFEITETAVIGNLASALRFIEKVRAVGCQVALDDFGAGLSSFSYLKAIPANYLKIDGSFIRDLLNDPMDMAIVDAVNRIGHVAGLQTIAEFVESPEVIERLRLLGVDFVQGFGVHRPERLGGPGRK